MSELDTQAIRQNWDGLTEAQVDEICDEIDRLRRDAETMALDHAAHRDAADVKVAELRDQIAALVEALKECQQRICDEGEWAIEHDGTYNGEVCESAHLEHMESLNALLTDLAPKAEEWRREVVKPYESAIRTLLNTYLDPEAANEFIHTEGQGLGITFTKEAPTDE